MEKRRADFNSGSRDVEASGLTMEEKMKRLQCCSSVTKYLLRRALDDKQGIFSIVGNSLKSLETSLIAIQKAKSPSDQDGVLIRNPLRIKPKEDQGNPSKQLGQRLKKMRQMAKDLQYVQKNWVIQDQPVLRVVSRANFMCTPTG